MNPLEHIEIVLVELQHGGNIGFTARAMKNMGLKKLVLVSPPKNWRKEAHVMAAGARDVLNFARVEKSLSSAVRNSCFIVGTTRRGGEVRSPKVWDRSVAKVILEKAREGVVSILFGNERVGLSGQELAYSHVNVTIPASTRHPSLNISHAVMILAYDLFLSSREEKAFVRQKNFQKYLATEKDLDEMCWLLKPALSKLGYANRNKRQNLDLLLDTVKNTAKKSEFEIREVRMIEGLARKILDLESNMEAVPVGGKGSRE